MDSIIIGYCDHCSSYFIVLDNQINCGIFRHGVYKTNLNQPIPPHLDKKSCDELVQQGKIYGCGKPLRWDGTKFNKCDYI